MHVTEGWSLPADNGGEVFYAGSGRCRDPFCAVPGDGRARHGGRPSETRGMPGSVLKFKRIRNLPQK